MSTDLTPARVEELAPAGHAVIRVPWRAVVPLAVGLAFANLFWVVALRVAVGSILRSQTPFESWVRESLLSVPLFVLAVLGALTLALHWFGPSPRGARQVFSTIGLVAGAATATGIAVLAASSFYDYRLETAADKMMGSMRQSCVGDCVAQQAGATLRLQLHSVGWGSLLLLATNLLLVGWAVAALGGRLRIGTSRPEGRVRFDTRAVLVAGLVGSAVIHAAVMPEHLAEWPAAASFFMLLTAAELVVAAWLVFAPRRQVPALVAAAAVSAGPLLLWLWSRTTGLPFGPEPGTPEAIGLADIAACVLEVVTLVLAVVLLRRVLGARRPSRSSGQVARLAFVAVVAVTVVGFAGASLPWTSVLVDGSAHSSQAAESS